MSDQIEMTMPEAMESLAMALDRILNGVEGNDPKNGFVLLIFPFNDKEGRCNYVSNGASRADVVRMFKAQITLLEEMEAREKARAADTAG